MKCVLDAYYFVILDDAYPLRMEMLKPRPVYNYGRIVLSAEEPHNQLRRQSACVIKAESHMMRRYMGMFGQIDGVGPEGKGTDIGMQWILISSESD